ncbi:aldo/keto reductase [Brevibacillus nitrificans]|uniref:Aldo/keto reductase n=1 Tax=Brevibacillus nitrificans TaxID=651560 RepID=A0A3M8D4I4_9BACL|nr:aldo/keto reductase [Brevibacillus nitrificans]
MPRPACSRSPRSNRACKRRLSGNAIIKKPSIRDEKDLDGRFSFLSEHERIVSLWGREIERAFPTLRELGVGIVAYSPLGKGFLTGSIKRYEDFSAQDIRRHFTRFQGENFQKNRDIVAQLEEIACVQQVTASQVALKRESVSRRSDPHKRDGQSDRRRL